jgi:hypothetical protein
MSHFKATRKGITASFTDEERLFLGDVLPMLAGIGATGDDPAATRLNVPVYLDDPSSNDEWWRLMGPELGEARKADRSVFARVVEAPGSVVLDEGEADAFLRVLNHARLVLGARLGIEVEEDHDRAPEEGRRALDYLGWIQEELTVELTRAL